MAGGIAVATAGAVVATLVATNRSAALPNAWAYAHGLGGALAPCATPSAPSRNRDPRTCTLGPFGTLGPGDVAVQKGSYVRADTSNLRQILTPERRYVIPTFQRDYEWTRETQWELLFSDLDATAQRLGEARGMAQATGRAQALAEKGVSPHFLGAIVCDQLPTSLNGLDMRAVIDGQQRLTTLQLLLRGVLDVLIEHDHPRVPAVRKLLRNPDDVVSAPYEQHKLWPRRTDREVWPGAMDDALADPETGEHLYLQARRYFAEATREAAVDAHGTSRLEDIVDALLNLFHVVVIDLEGSDDAQVIFEVLNGRQTTLSASDLVKNLLFLRGELADESELEKLYDRYWADFDDPWWKAEVGTGHAARGRRDVLLSVWLTAVQGREASVAHLYGEVRAFLDRTGRKTDDVLTELYAYGQAYRAIYGAADAGSDLLRTAYARLDRLRIRTAVPLLAWLRTLPVARLPLGEHERAVAAIESWFVRRQMVGWTTRGYGAAVVAVLRAARLAADDPTASVADAVVAALADRPNGLDWPTDDDVQSAFERDQFYDRFTQERIRLILAAIDVRMRADNPYTEPATFDYERLQIEHVMPRAWSTHWPLPDDLGAAELEVATRDRSAAVHRIGNLTLVTSTFNGSVSNLAWDTTKRPELARQSALQLTGPIVAVEHWDEDAIRARGRALAEVACRVWFPPPARP